MLVPGKTCIFSATESFTEMQTQQQNSDISTEWSGRAVMGSYKGDLAETKLLQQSREYQQPKGNFIPSDVARKNNFCSQDVKLMQSPRDEDTARMSQWERTMGGSRPRRGTFHSLLNPSEMSSDTAQKCKEVCRAGGSSGWKERGKLVFFIPSKICSTSPPPSQMTALGEQRKLTF